MEDNTNSIQLVFIVVLHLKHIYRYIIHKVKRYIDLYCSHIVTLRGVINTKENSAHNKNREEKTQN